MIPIPKKTSKNKKGGNNYQNCIDKCNKEFINSLDIARDTGASNSVVLSIHKKRQDCLTDCPTSVVDIHGGKIKTRRSKKQKRKTKRRRCPNGTRRNKKTYKCKNKK
jgi:hypothetical protein